MHIVLYFVGSNENQVRGGRAIGASSRSFPVGRSFPAGRPSLGHLFFLAFRHWGALPASLPSSASLQRRHAPLQTPHKCTLPHPLFPSSQAYYLQAPYAIERAPTVPLPAGVLSAGGAAKAAAARVVVQQLAEYPVRALVFEAQHSLEEASGAVAGLGGPVKLAAAGLPGWGRVGQLGWLASSCPGCCWGAGGGSAGCLPGAGPGSRVPYPSPLPAAACPHW